MRYELPFFVLQLVTWPRNLWWWHPWKCFSTQTLLRLRICKSHRTSLLSLFNKVTIAVFSTLHSSVAIPSSLGSGVNCLSFNSDFLLPDNSFRGQSKPRRLHLRGPQKGEDLCFTLRYTLRASVMCVRALISHRRFNSFPFQWLYPASH